MNKEEDYTSDSDDEDFCPEKAGDVAPASEDESDEEEEGHEEETSNKKPTKGRKKVLTKKSKKAKKHSDDDDEDEEEEVNEGSRRSTRQTEEADSAREKSKHDKDELESDDNEKSRTDALWADFLGDVKQPVAAKKSNTSAVNKASSSKAEAVPETSPVEAKTTTPDVEKPKQITVTEIVDFAGEEVRVEKTVSAESIKENKVTPVAGISGRSGFPAGLKRPSAGGSGGGGLGSLLNQLGKKKKLSVLEKTKLDWSSFKQDEGIDEQLQTFNKGKDGYLERQDFLQRTDLRQFEIEKNLRQTRRNNN